MADSCRYGHPYPENRILAKNGYVRDCRECRRLRRRGIKQVLPNAMAVERTCYKCKETKPINVFLKDRRKPGGFSYQCIECKRVENALRARRKYWDDLEYHRSRRGKNRKKGDHLKRIREHEDARIATRAAIRRGDLIRPNVCEDCGETSPIEAHHEDYSKPLAVNWLCKACHGMRHRKYEGEAA